MRQILIEYVFVDTHDAIVKRPITVDSIGKVFELARITITRNLNTKDNLAGLVKMLQESYAYMKNTYKKTEKKNEK